LVLLHSFDGKVVTKDELIQHCWEGAAVSDDVITRCIFQLRSLAKRLGGSTFAIRTVPKVGYALDRLTPQIVSSGSADTMEKGAPVETSGATKRVAFFKEKPAAFLSVLFIALVLGGTVYLASGNMLGMFGAQKAQPNKTISLAILPFQIMDSPSSEPDPLSNGIAATLNANLSGLSGLSLISDNSTQRLSQQGLNVAQIADSLDVGHLVEGTLRYSGEEVVMTASFIEVETSRKIWTSTRRGNTKSVGILVNGFSKELAAVLTSRFGVGGQILAVDSLSSPEASEAYFRGMQYLATRQVGDNRQKAFAELSKVNRLEPDFAPAHAALGVLAQSYRLLAPNATEQKAVAERAIGRALQIDPDNLLARVAEQTMASRFGGDVDNSIRNLQEIVRENPEFAYGQFALGQLLAEVGEHRKALIHYSKAKQIDPVDVNIINMNAHSLLAIGDYFELRRISYNCSGCFLELIWWSRGAIWLSNDILYETDTPVIAERTAAMGVPNPDRIYTRVSRAVRERRALPDGWRDVFPPTDVSAATYAAASGDHEAALTTLAEYPFDRPTAALVMYVLDTADDIWPEEVRADPRYHAFFDHPGVKSVVASRRTRGHSQNLPVFPIKSYNSALQ